MDDIFKQFISLYFILMLGFIQLGIYLVGKLSGWSLLSKKYTNYDSAFIKFRKFQSMRMGWCNYSGCMNFAATPAGLHMKVFVLFSAGHPPLLLPWTIFTHATKSKWNIFLGHTFFIQLENKKLKLRLPKNLSEEIISKKYMNLSSN
jgi:hypothetical protein